MHIVAIAIVSMFFSCVDSEKDLYDPSYQTSNPLGEGFAAPEGFNWAMTTTKTVTVEVNDEYNGSYFYTIEIYSENPLANDNALLLGKGVAKKGQNLVTSISLNQNQEGIYVKQTDPKGRVEVYLFDAPEDSNNITCKLYYTENQSHALKTRAALATTRATAITKPEYAAIPSNAIEITSSTGNLQPNTSYKISSPYDGSFTYSGGSSNVRLYVDATWTVPAEFSQFQSGIEIIVTKKGKIVAGSRNLSFNGSSIMTILDEGSVSANNITFSNGPTSGLRNWGTLTVTNAITLSAGAFFYNIGTLTSKDFTVYSNSQIINNKSFAITGDINLPSNFTLENNGIITGNKLTGNSSSTITNSNAMTLNEISLNGTTVYNNCSMEAKTLFSATGCTITLEKGYMKGNNVTLAGSNVTMNNGSMIEAVNELKLESRSAYFTAIGTNPSLIKAATVTGQGFTYDGNLAVESNNHVVFQSWGNYHVEHGAYLTKLGESKVYIEVCTGIKNGGNGGTDPTNPTFPIIVDNNHQYTYTFEDQWPLYGDYDMNDIVMTIKNRKYTLDNANKVKEFTFSIDLDAVGATKSIAAAIMFDAVPASAISEAVVLGDNNLIKSFSLSNRNIENGQDYAVVPLFDNAHASLGRSKYEPINTVNGYASNTNAKSISFTIKFTNPTLTAEAFDINKLNLFIIVEGNSSKRREIHIAGFQPTKLANTDLFGGNNDASSVSGKKYYISKDNLAWGIIVPTSFKWALEYTNIKVAYSKFESWVSTGGMKEKNWWNDFNEAKVFQTNKN